MSKPGFILSALALICLSVFLFVTAPPPLPDRTESGPRISAERALTILNAENARVRAIYTRDIVGAGLKVGLKFDERWREDGVQAGPLPALFLRETSRRLERRPVALGLFLGSKYPIASANRFTGDQARYFEAMEASGEPAFFHSADTDRYTAMFPDPAGVQACVSCHNKHPGSPKTDWRLNDIMGATTWSLPSETVSPSELLELIDALRGSVSEAYATYLDKARLFDNPPPIGDSWPAAGYALPTQEAFMARVRRECDSVTMDALLAHGFASHRPGTETAEAQP